MKVLNLERNNKKYRAHISPDGYGCYEYTLYEVLPKKHWWSSGKRYVGSGIIWEDIELEILAHIDSEIKRENKINRLAEQFNKL